MGKHPRHLPVELEVKLLLPAGAEAVFAAHPALSDAGKAETRREVTTYYDTATWDLAQAGATLRVRRIGSQRVQTLKLHGQQGPFGRNEWEWPRDGDGPEPDRLAGTPVASALAGGDDLRPVFVTDIRRTVRTIRHDGATIEAALDLGKIKAGEAAEEIRELELELKSGEPAALYRLAAVLHLSTRWADLPPALGAESKSDRGMRLCTGHPRPAVKQDDIHLPHDATVADGFRRIVRAVLSNLLANLPAAASGDAEGVHQMRVAIRRLRAVLVLFRPHLEPHATARFNEALRQLGRVLGEARDWDVFCTETIAAAEARGVAASSLSLLRSPAETARAAAHSMAAMMLREPALSATVLGLAAWAEDPAALSGSPDGGGMGARLTKAGPVLEARLERKVRRRGRHIGERDDPELHALRKSLKKLRYGVEFLAPLQQRKPVKSYLRSCKSLLKQLGRINDANVAVRLADGLGGEHRPELAPALGALGAWADTTIAGARRRLQTRWRAFQRTPCRIDRP